jgi:hypothetical protein
VLASTKGGSVLPVGLPLAIRGGCKGPRETYQLDPTDHDGLKDQVRQQEQQEQPDRQKRKGHKDLKVKKTRVVFKGRQDHKDQQLQQ